MAEKPLMERLPADLPEDWTAGQIVAPTGEEVGMSHQHGYNYLMEMVNRAHRGVNSIGKFFADGILPVENGGTGVSSIEELKALLGAGELGKFILTGTYKGHVTEGQKVTLYFKPETETGAEAEFNAIRGQYGQIVLCSIETESTDTGQTVWIELNNRNNQPALWLTGGTPGSGKITARIPLVADKSDGMGIGYTAISPIDNFNMKGDCLDIRCESGEFDYHVEMLLLMPDIEYMGLGSSGGSSPSIPGGNFHGVPAGGTKGQMLAKRSADDYDIEWAAPPSGGGGTADFSNLIKLPGGGEMSIPAAFGSAPYTITVTQDDESASGVTMEQVDAAIAEAVRNYVTSATVSRAQVLTETEYTALASKDAKTLYLIKE